MAYSNLCKFKTRWFIVKWDPHNRILFWFSVTKNHEQSYDEHPISGFGKWTSGYTWFSKIDLKWPLVTPGLIVPGFLKVISEYKLLQFQLPVWEFRHFRSLNFTKYIRLTPIGESGKKFLNSGVWPSASSGKKFWTLFKKTISLAWPSLFSWKIYRSKILS